MHCLIQALKDFVLNNNNNTLANNNTRLLRWPIFLYVYYTTPEGSVECIDGLGPGEPTCQILRIKGFCRGMGHVSKIWS